MNLTQLAQHIRHLTRPGAVIPLSVCTSVCDLVRQAYRAGAFMSPHFTSLREEIAPQLRAGVDIAVFHGLIGWLEDQGYNLHGVATWQEQLSRLADALDSEGGKAAGPEVSWNVKRRGFKYAKEIVEQYNGKQLGKALVVKLDYNKLRGFVFAHGIPYMRYGQRLRIRAKAFATAFTKHGKDLTKVEAMPDLVAEVKERLRK